MEIAITNYNKYIVFTETISTIGKCLYTFKSTLFILSAAIKIHLNVYY